MRKAKKQIEDKVRELVNIKEDFVDIAPQLHTALIGKNGNIIKQIRNECSGVIINFPPSAGESRIVLKGSAEQITKAKAELLKLAEARHDASFQDELSNVKLEYHKFLVGRNGAKVSQLRDKYQVRIIFPTSSEFSAAAEANNNNNVITIIGKKENVAKVKAELEQAVKSLEEQITDEIEVDAKWHKNFTTRRAKLINKISEDNCNVKISFPKAGVAGGGVKVTGPREAVDAAKRRIAELVFEFENQVTLQCHIPHRCHAQVIGKKGVNTQRISDEFNVEIKFQAKSAEVATAATATASTSKEEVSNENGENEEPENELSSSSSSSQGAAVSKSDIILVSGLREDCEKAKEALLALVPVTEQVYNQHKRMQYESSLFTIFTIFGGRGRYS